MHADVPWPPCAADLSSPRDAPLDTTHAPFPCGPFSPRSVWSADDLIEAVHLPLHCAAFAPSANDARLHRPRRTARFLASPPLDTRFRISG